MVSRGFWEPVADIAMPAVAGSEMMLMMPGLSATASFFEEPWLPLLKDWPLLSQKMDRFCTLPHALNAGLNTEMLETATLSLHRYYIDMYRHALESVLKAGFAESSQSLQAYFLEIVQPVLDHIDINNRFQLEYLHVPFSLIKSVSGIADDVKKTAFYAVLDLLRERVLMHELAADLTPDLGLGSRQDWCRSLLQNEQKEVLFGFLYASVYGDMEKRIAPRNPTLTKTACLFLEKLFHFPKDSMDPFVDFYFNYQDL